MQAERAAAGVQLGVAAVVGVPGAVSRIKTGDELLVDGTTGTVTITAVSGEAPIMTG